MRLILVFYFTFIFSKSFALVGEGILLNDMYEKNQEIKSLEDTVNSQEALADAARSEFYPTLNLVGGWGRNQLDELSSPEKGYIGYVEGKFNLFSGFKSYSLNSQRSIDLKISQIDFEVKKRDLRLSWTEILSNMIYLHKLKDILIEELRVTQNHKKMADKKVSAGLTSNVDKYEFDLREQEIQIEQRQIDQQHEEAHEKLIQIYGEDIPDQKFEKLEFSKAQDLLKMPKDFDINQSLAYQRSVLIEQKSEYDRMYSRSDFLPSLDFTYSVGRITPSEQMPLKYNESQYAVKLTIPLFSGFDTYYRSKASNLSNQAAIKLQAQKKNDVNSQLNILKSKIKELYDLYVINEKKSENTQKYFSLTEAEYKRGIKNSPDLVSSTERLFSTKRKNLEILKEMEIVKIKIENLM